MQYPPMNEAFPTPVSLTAQQMRSMQRIISGDSEATPLSVSEVVSQARALQQNGDLHPETRRQLGLFASRMEVFATRFDSESRAQSGFASPALRAAFEIIVHLQSSPDVPHLPFRVFNATLIALALEIIRCLNLKLDASSSPGSPSWVTPNATSPSSLRSSTRGKRESRELPERMEWCPPYSVKSLFDL